MRLFLTCECDSNEAADMFFEVSRDIESLINKYLHEMDYANPDLLSWVCIPVIRNDNRMASFITYSSNKKEADFRPRLKYSTFVQGSLKERRKRVLKMLGDGINWLIKYRKVKDLDPVLNILEKVQKKMDNQ